VVVVEPVVMIDQQVQLVVVDLVEEHLEEELCRLVVLVEVGMAAVFVV
jgi:hypothetical protein